MKSDQPSQVKEHLYVLRLPFTGESVEVEHIIPHPNFKPQGQDWMNDAESLVADLAILQLKPSLITTGASVRRASDLGLAQWSFYDVCGIAITRRVKGEGWTSLFYPLKDIRLPGIYDSVLRYFADENQVSSDTLNGTLAAPPVLPGDSGSPLFCRTSQGRLVVMGLAKGGTPAESDLVAVQSLEGYEEWITSFLEKSP